MSLTLPMHALSTMQVSFKVGLPDGKFAFNMVSGNDAENPSVPLESGMKLHLRAVGDSSGVTLTLCVSRDNEEGLGSLVDINSQPLSQLGSRGPPFDHIIFHREPELNNSLEFLSHFDDDATAELLDLTLATIPGAEPQDSPFNLPNALGNFTLNEFLLDGDVNYNCDDNSDSDIPYPDDTPIIHIEGPAFDSTPLAQPATPHLEIFEHNVDAQYSSDGSSVPPSPTTEDIPSTAPSTPSDIPPSRRGSPSRPHAKHRCPDPVCARNFTSDYTLAKHMKAHLPKSQKSFPCTMGCTMDFSRKHDRLRHEVAQHGRICESECKTCLGFFSSEATLKKHKCKARARP
ncbi:hypothetical protein DFH09DRAFT_1339840 [Mycena vulgaris]|nr:hypothetical protein DFH09DRAFT_1339840 [Mycena vulgaris]